MSFTAFFVFLPLEKSFMKSNPDSSKLRQMRKDAELSQWPIARALGRTQGWLSNIELGYVTPSQAIAHKIAAAIQKLKAGKA
jgi:DNA-binding XRE family transcriptional regulator